MSPKRNGAKVIISKKTYLYDNKFQTPTNEYLYDLVIGSVMVLEIGSLGPADYLPKNGNKNMTVNFL